MFRPSPRLDPGAAEVRFRFEGREMRAPGGISLAAALLLNGETWFRDSALTGARRGPFCLMGMCFECLVEVDGKRNRQACMVEVVEDMEVRRQRHADAGP